MENMKPMTFLLLDDDIDVGLEFENSISVRNDARLVGITGDSDKALEMVKEHMPEVVIVDIELRKGKGSGIEFIDKIQKIHLDFVPLLIVITNIDAKVVYEHAHKNGVALVFSKKQKGYCADFVLNSVLPMRAALHSINKESIKEDGGMRVESLEIRRKRLQNRIDTEMNLIGMSSHLNGRKYIMAGLLYLLENDDNERDETVFQYIARTHNRSNSTIVQTIETAIRNAWDKTPIDDILIHYTQQIDYKTGVPTPTEFVYYYYNKIRASL